MRFILNNVRVAFPVIWTPEPFPDGKDPTPYFSLTGIMAPDHPQLPELRKAIESCAQEKFGTNWKAVLAAAERLGKVCLRDGDLKPDLEGYPGNFTISMRGKVRPTIVGKNKEILVEADGKPYSGCYVNLIFDLFAYTTSAKGVAAGLKGVQFRADGDAFSGSAPASVDDFENMADTGDDLAG